MWKVSQSVSRMTDEGRMWTAACCEEGVTARTHGNLINCENVTFCCNFFPPGTSVQGFRVLLSLCAHAPSLGAGCTVPANIRAFTQICHLPSVRCGSCGNNFFEFLVEIGLCGAAVRLQVRSIHSVGKMKPIWVKCILYQFSVLNGITGNIGIVRSGAGRGASEHAELRWGVDIITLPLHGTALQTHTSFPALICKILPKCSQCIMAHGYKWYVERPC